MNSLFRRVIALHDLLNNMIMYNELVEMKFEKDVNTAAHVVFDCGF